MDLWDKFGMSEGIAELWQELGISAGTAIVVLAALYFVIKWAVKNGMLEAYKKIESGRLDDCKVLIIAIIIKRILCRKLKQQK